MKSPDTAGLRDQMPPGASLGRGSTGPALPWSPSPETTIPYKSYRSQRCISRLFDITPSNSYNRITASLGASRTPSFLTLRTTTTDRRVRPTAASDGAGGPARPAASGSEPPGTAAECPEAVAPDRPAGSAPLWGDPEAGAQPRPEGGGRLRRVAVRCCSRWSE